MEEKEKQKRMKIRDIHGGCLLCGRPIRYESHSVRRICGICKKPFVSPAACEKGHYVCDDCHSLGYGEFLAFLAGAEEKNPVKLFLEAVRLPSIHLHGPEHHTLVPCVLLAAYRNNGGELPMPYEAAIGEAVLRGRQVPGGFCGFWGVCGAAVGAGIYASIVTDCGPLNEESWAKPQRLTARCLERIAQMGGVRCCKRTCRTALLEAAEFTREELGVEMETEAGPCAFSLENRECLRAQCPYYSSSSDSSFTVS